MAHQRDGIAAMLGVERQPDAGRHAQFVAVQAQRFGELLHDLLGHALAVFDGRDAGQQDHELVTAQARHDVRGAHGLAQAARHFDEHGVTQVVAQAVVDLLEAVQVQEHHGHEVAFAFGRGQAELELLLQHVAVGQAGQRVVQGHVLDLVLGFAARGHVVGHHQVAALRAVLAAHFRDEQLCQQAGAILSHQRPLGGQAWRGLRHVVEHVQGLHRLAQAHGQQARAFGHLLFVEKALDGEAPHQLVRLVAQQVFARGVDRLHDAVLAEHEDGVGRVVHDHAAHLIDFVELAVRLHDGVLGRLLGAEVTHHADVLAQAVQQHGADGQLQGEALAARAQAFGVAAQTVHAHALRLQEALDPHARFLRARLWQQQLEVLADDGRFAVPEHAAHSLVDAEDATGGRHGEDAVDGVVHHRAQALLTVARLLAHALRHLGDACMPAGGVAHHQAQDQGEAAAAQQQRQWVGLGQGPHGRASELQAPVAAAHFQGVHLHIAGVAVGCRAQGLGPACAVEQRRGVGRRVVDAQVQALPCRAVVGLGHQVGDADGAADQALERCAATRHGLWAIAVTVHGQPHHQAQRVCPTLDQLDGR